MHVTTLLLLNTPEVAILAHDTPEFGEYRMRGSSAVLVIPLAAVLSMVPGVETMRAEAAVWAQTAGINSTGFAVREPLPGQLGYLQAIRFIDYRMKYLDPLSAFFVS